MIQFFISAMLSDVNAVRQRAKMVSRSGFIWIDSLLQHNGTSIHVKKSNFNYSSQQVHTKQDDTELYQ